jgi:hypothetical protein
MVGFCEQFGPIDHLNPIISCSIKIIARIYVRWLSESKLKQGAYSGVEKHELLNRPRDHLRQTSLILMSLSL